jgi:aminoglycoside phosphotransferase (APT) family kinase protein
MNADRLLAEARSALAGALEDVDPERIVLTSGGQSRRRSEVLFLGLSDEAPRRRWVLKVPNTEVQQHDAPSPLDADQQVASLRRLAAHLDARRTRVFVPRVVATVPSVGGYLMEYVDGTPLTSYFTLRALADDRMVLHGAEEAAEVLRALHELEPPTIAERDTAALWHTSVARARQVLGQAGLPTRSPWLQVPEDAAMDKGAKVLLHADYAPENVMLTPRGTCCLDADLVELDWAEQDVTRYLVMLYDAPLFVVLADLPAAQRLRRRAARAFLDAYYADRELDASLRPLMLAALATRWATRDGDVARRRPRLGRQRGWLLRRHFTQLLDETASPEWPQDLG